MFLRPSRWGPCWHYRRSCDIKQARRIPLDVQRGVSRHWHTCSRGKQKAAINSEPRPQNSFGEAAAPKAAVWFLPRPRCAPPSSWHKVRPNQTKCSSPCARIGALCQVVLALADPSDVMRASVSNLSRKKKGPLDVMNALKMIINWGKQRGPRLLLQTNVMSLVTVRIQQLGTA